MPYTHRPPCPGLRDVVERIGIQEAPAAAEPAPPTRILPTGTTELVFQYADAFVDGLEHPSESPRACIAGQRSAPSFTRATGRTGLVIVMLAPWGLSALLGDAARQLDRAFADLADLLPAGALHPLQDTLDRATSAEVRIAAVERFLLSLRSAEADPVARAAIALMHTGTPRVDEIAGHLDLGVRQFERRFRAAVGLSPKRFGRILRLQRAIGQLRCGHGAADAAAASGFYDQPQFQRDCLALTGLTPGSLLAAVGRTPLTRAYNDQAMSRFYNTMFLH